MLPARSRHEPRGHSPDEMTDSEPIARLNAMARGRNWQTKADATLSFVEPELVVLRDVWLGLTGNSRMPARAELTARMLKPFLPHITVIELVRSEAAPVRFVHRYVGTAITRYFGETTGLSFEDFLPPERVPATRAFFEAVVETRRALRIITHFQLPHVSYLYGEVLAMPLADDGVTPNRLMTAAYFSDGEKLAQEIRGR
jgi:hypothetical protein